jgi:hypothetical protein
MSIGGVNGPKFDPSLKATEDSAEKPSAKKQPASIFNQTAAKACTSDDWSTGGWGAKDCD